MRPADRHRFLVGVAGLLTAGIFLLDLQTPTGIADGMLYVIPVLLGLWLPSPRFSLTLALVGTVLTLWGHPLSGPGEMLWISRVNRGFSILVIWAGAFFVLGYARLEARLRSERVRAENYLEIAGVMILALAPDETVALINRKGCDVLGRARQDIVGHNWFDRFVASSVREDVRERFRRFLREPAGQTDTFENPIITASGEERLIAWHSTTLRGSDGSIQGTLSSGADITERRHAQQALERSLKDLSGLKYALDQSAIVATTDVKGIITYANDKFCEISKYSREELIGRDHRIVNSTYHSKEFIRNLWRTIAAGEIWRGEIRNRAKDGTVYWVDTTIVPFLDARGKPYQYMAIRYDITERKRSEERLREQEALARLGQMAAVVAHEVKNPLAGLRGALQVIGKRLAPALPERDILQEMVARIDSLNAMIQELLLFARPRSPVFGPVPVKELIDETVALVMRDPAFHKLRISASGPALTISADPDLLKPVFLNLLLNAAQAVPASGHIDVRLQADDACRIVIADTGSGIPLEHRDKIFQPFFTTRHRGTGLGLAIAKRAVELHGGEIAVQFPPEGGTTVVITLPLRQIIAPADVADGAGATRR
ncbi:MAG: PAS domain S-box protein [Acidobacteria bacterium]|nr:PAS domain S-box protein [Acidobacteriota bacterium]